MCPGGLFVCQGTRETPSAETARQKNGSIRRRHKRASLETIVDISAAFLTRATLSNREGNPNNFTFEDFFRTVTELSLTGP